MEFNLTDPIFKFHSYKNKTITNESTIISQCELSSIYYEGMYETLITRPENEYILNVGYSELKDDIMTYKDFQLGITGSPTNFDMCQPDGFLHAASREMEEELNLRANYNDIIETYHGEPYGIRKVFTVSVDKTILIENQVEESKSSDICRDKVSLFVHGSKESIYNIMESYNNIFRKDNGTCIGYICAISVEDAIPIAQFLKQRKKKRSKKKKSRNLRFQTYSCIFNPLLS